MRKIVDQNVLPAACAGSSRPHYIIHQHTVLPRAMRRMEVIVPALKGSGGGGGGTRESGGFGREGDDAGGLGS